MKRAALLITFVILSNITIAQWVQTNGPYGGTAQCFVTIGSNLFVGTDGGVSLSTNDGASWINVSEGFPQYTGVNTLTYFNLNIYAGTNNGVFLSSNNGSSWTAVNSGLPFTSVYSFAVSGMNLFAGTWDGVFLSTNNGTNWTAINNGLTSTIISALTVSGTNLFAGTNDGVFLSTNNGTNWTIVNNGLPEFSDVRTFAVSGTDLFAAISGGGVFLSTNDGISWSAVNNGLVNLNVLTLAFSDTNLFAGTVEGGVFLSTNRGTSWIPVNNGLTNTFILALAVSNTKIFAGTMFGGIFLSTNNGTSWTVVNNNLAFTCVYALASFNTNIFVGTSGAGVFLSTNEGTSWTPVNNGLPTHGLNNVNDAFAYSSPNLFNGTSDGVFLSTDNGTNWTAVNNGLPEYIWVYALAVSGMNLFAGTWDGVFLSTNNGTNWTSVNNGLPQYRDVRILAVSGTDLFAAIYGGGVFLSTNDGISWSAVNNGLTSTDISALTVSGTNLFAGTINSGVFLSTNNGTDWTAVNSGLTNTAISALTVSGTNLFAGTHGGGVFLSTNNGTSWTAFNSGLPSTYVDALAVSGTNLFAGTCVSGVWRRPLSEMIEPPIIPIIVIPGIEGSPLYNDKNDNNRLGSQERIWMDLDKTALTRGDGFLDVLQLAENGIDPSNPLYKIKVSPLQDDAGWTIEDELTWPSYPSHIYGGLLYFLSYYRPGYSIDNFDSIHLESENIFIFNYDWRKSNNYNGELLNQLISNVLTWTNSTKVNLIAHSMGGFVAKSCITDPTFDKNKINKLFFIGTPHLGAPKILYAALTGDLDIPWYEDLFSPNQNEIIKISRNMPSLYSLFPSKNYFKVHINNGISTDRYLYFSCFLDAGDNNLNYSDIQQYFKVVSLGSGRTLNSTLIDAADDYRSTIENVNFGNIQVYNIVGFDLPTVSEVKDKTNLFGSHKPELELNLTGDGTVPMRSAETINLSQKKANYYIKGVNHSELPSSLETSYILGRLLYDLDTTFLASETIWDHPPASYASPTFFQIALNGPGNVFIMNTGSGIQTTHLDLSSDDSNVSDSTIGSFESDFIINAAKVKEEVLLSDISSNGEYELWIGLFDKGELLNEQFTPPFELLKNSKIFVDLNEVNNHFSIKIDINGDGKTDATILTEGNSNLAKETVIFPLEYSLSQNFPNPFNPITQIIYAIPEKRFVSLKVFDILGKEVATLVSEEKEPGFYTVDFNGIDLSSGLYVYRIQAGNFIQSKKMILLK